MIPEDQIDFLKKTLKESDRPCFVFTHQNLDRAVDKDYHIKKGMTIRRILTSSGKVKAVFNGHFHAGGYNVIGGIKYITVPSMTDTDVNEYMIVTL